MVKKTKHVMFETLCWILAIMSVSVIIFMLLLVETYFVAKASWFAFADNTDFCSNLGEYNRDMLYRIISIS